MMTFLKPGYRWNYSRPGLSLSERLMEAACWAVHEDYKHEWDENNACSCGLVWVDRPATVE